MKEFKRIVTGEEQRQLTGLEKVSQALQKAIDAAQTNKAVGGEDTKYARSKKIPSGYIQVNYTNEAKNDILDYINSYEDKENFERDRQDRLRSLIMETLIKTYCQNIGMLLPKTTILCKKIIHGQITQ